MCRSSNHGTIVGKQGRLRSDTRVDCDGGCGAKSVAHRRRAPHRGACGPRDGQAACGLDQYRRSEVRSAKFESGHGDEIACCSREVRLSDVGHNRHVEREDARPGGNLLRNGECRSQTDTRAWWRDASNLGISNPLRGGAQRGSEVRGWRPVLPTHVEAMN